MTNCEYCKHCMTWDMELEYLRSIPNGPIEACYKNQKQWRQQRFTHSIIRFCKKFKPNDNAKIYKMESGIDIK